MLAVMQTHHEFTLIGASHFSVVPLIDCHLPLVGITPAETTDCESANGDASVASLVSRQVNESTTKQKRK